MKRILMTLALLAGCATASRPAITVVRPMTVAAAQHKASPFGCTDSEWDNWQIVHSGKTVSALSDSGLASVQCGE